MQDSDGIGAGMTPDNVDSPRSSPTGFVITVVVLLVIGCAALFIPSTHTIQVIGFAIITLVAIVCLIEFRPKRPGRRRIPLRMRTNYLPGTGRVVRPDWPEEPGPGERAGVAATESAPRSRRQARRRRRMYLYTVWRLTRITSASVAMRVAPGDPGSALVLLQ